MFIVTVMTAEDIRQISSPLTSKHGDKCQESQQGLRVNNNERKTEASYKKKIEESTLQVLSSSRSFLLFQPFNVGVIERRGFSAQPNIRDIANVRMIEECFVLRCHAVMNG